MMISADRCWLPFVAAGFLAFAVHGCSSEDTTAEPPDGTSATGDGGLDGSVDPDGGAGAPPDGGWPETSGETAPPDGCVPACDGRICGNDGCGGTCPPGCAAGLACSPDGQCVTCPPMWKHDLAGVLSVRGDLELDGALLIASGASSSLAWLAEITACEGQITQSTLVPLPQSTGTFASACVVTQEDIFFTGTAVEGADPGNALVGQVTRTTFAPGWVKGFVGTAEDDRGGAIAITSGGNLWVAGATAASSTSPRPWLIKSSSQGDACGFIIGTEVGLAGGIDAVGDDVYVAVTIAGEVVVQRYVDGDCPVAPPCTCSPAWSSDAITVQEWATPEALVVDGETAYVTGAAIDTASGTNDMLGFAVAVDLSSGSLEGSYEWNPGATAEGFFDLATDGTQLYLGGFGSWDEQDLMTAIGAVHALGLPMDETVDAPAWTVEPRDMHIVSGIAADPDAQGGLYVFGSTDGVTNSRILRCQKSGTCPD